MTDEEERATHMLKGKVVKNVWRHRDHEIGIEFEDGTRFFADSESVIELSITGQFD